MSNEAPTDALRLVPADATDEMIAAWYAEVEAGIFGVNGDNGKPHEEYNRAAYRALLAAAPASPLPGGGWQDISTFKGTEEDYVLIGGTDGLVCEARLLYDGSGWWSRGNNPTDHWGEELFPTHWMPLPAAPTGEPK